MTNEQINKEAECSFEKYQILCTDVKESWMRAYLLGYKNGEGDGLEFLLKAKS